MNSIDEFVIAISENISSDQFVKLTLSKAVGKQDLQNVYFRIIMLRGEQMMSANWRYKTNDQTKNYTLEEGLLEIGTLLKHVLRNATLFTKEATFQLQSSKKGKVNITKKIMDNKAEPSATHDRKKQKRALLSARYLLELGVTNEEGELIPKMADKYRQINKYLEIMDGLIVSNKLKGPLNIVDMGSGKGYLTFALYEYLTINKGIKVNMVGIELREELVTFCNEKAAQCGFDGLLFRAERIENYKDDAIDVLIALHACDTATDDAMAKGILASAKLIVCAPCCHKQVRQQVKGKEQENPLLNYGIFQERYFEMITDTIRALLLEKNGYQSKIFEFVSNEHTRKNIMLVGAKSNPAESNEAAVKIESLKKESHLDFHYLEGLVD